MEKSIVAEMLRYLIVGGALLAGAGASAQQADTLETVQNRARPALDPLGLRLGNFVFSPSLLAEGKYHDNIFADDAITVDDVIVAASPAFSLESDWNNHSFGISAEADIARYSENEAEDFEDLAVALDWRLDASRVSYLGGSIEHLEQHEERTSADDVGDASLTEYTVDAASLSYYRQANRFFLQLDYSVREHDFEDAIRRSEVVNNDDRNRRWTQQGLRLGYEFVPGSSVYLRGTVDSTQFEQRIDDDGFERSSDGYEVVLGATRMISGVSSASAFVGFRSQDYDDARFETADGVSFGASIVWNITNLMTLNAEARRRVIPTNIFGASGIEATTYGLTIDYELLRRLILSVDGVSTGYDYEGIDREDEVLGSSFGVKYMLTRNLYIHLGYEYERREVQPRAFADDDYVINTGFLRLQGQL